MEVDLLRNNVLPEHFSFAQEVENGVVPLRLLGELDLATAPLLEAELERARAQAVVLDLGELTFIDLAGLRAVLAAESQARENNQELTLMDGSKPVRRLFELTGAEGLLDGGDLGDADHE
jgi:anti-anti-sigma factor